MQFNIDDWKGFDEDKIGEYSENLTFLPDYIPVLILWNSNINMNKRTDFIKKEGLYGKVINEELNLKRLLGIPVIVMNDILMRECISFIEKYPEYQDMIKFINRRG